MRYIALTLLISVIYSQDIQRTSEFKRDVAYGQDCDDIEITKDTQHGKVMVGGYLNVIQFVL